MEAKGNNMSTHGMRNSTEPRVTVETAPPARAANPVGRELARRSSAVSAEGGGAETAAARLQGATRIYTRLQGATRI